MHCNSYQVVETMYEWLYMQKAETDCAAEEAGAAKVPQASLHLQLAKEHLELAKRLSKNGEKERADSMLMRAEADAELAVKIAREDAEKMKAQKAIESVRKLKEENTYSK